MGRTSCRASTNAYLGLDVRQLARVGLFTGGPGSWSRWRWSSGHLARVEYLPGDVVEVRRTVRADDVERELVGRVELAWKPCTYGGRRPWWSCPSCGRACAWLYLEHGHRLVLGCRRCFRLVYPSTRLRADDRLAWRLQRIMGRLQADEWTADPRFLPKPRGMRWATYERLVREAEATEEARIAAILGASARWLQRIQGRA